MKHHLDLQLFAEGGDGAGTSGVTGQDAAGRTGVMDQAAAGQNRSAGSGAPEAQANTPAAKGGKQNATQDDAAGWQEAKTKYKTQYDADVQNIVRGRLKDAESNAQTLAALQPMLESMAKQFGVNASDHQALIDRYFDDDSLYEQEASETGLTVDAVKQMHKLRTERDRAQAEVSKFTAQAQMEQHLRGLVQQSDSFRAKYPAFNLDEAMQDERFVRMTSPNGGLTVEQAYAALHHDEMQAYAMQQAAQQSRIQAAQTVQANMARPRENAARGMAPAAPVRNDPSTLKVKDFRSILDQARSGAKISFD